MQNPSSEQRRLMKAFEDHAGFEFLGIGDISADDPIGFIEQWSRNIEWLQDVAAECGLMINDYRMLHEYGKEHTQS